MPVFFMIAFPALVPACVVDPVARNVVDALAYGDVTVTIVNLVTVFGHPKSYSHWQVCRALIVRYRVFERAPRYLCSLGINVIVH
jgi:hypothetical protein